MRPSPRIKFIWGASAVIRGRWYAGLFGFYDRLPGMPDSGLAISVRGLLCWLGVLAAIAYVALASVLFWLFWKKNPYNRLSFSDALLYPMRRAEIAEKKGQAFIAQGLALFEDKKYHDAANLLRLGLARYPHDTKARKTLAQFYVMANQRALALRILQDGLNAQYPGREYLELLFGAAEQVEDHGLVESVSARYLASLPASESEADRRWLLERRFAALTNLERHDETLALADSAGPGDFAAELRVMALLNAKRPADALTTLAEWAQRPGANRAAVARLMVRAYRDAEHYDDMERALEELRALAPSEPAAYVFGVVQRTLAGRSDAARAALDDYVFRFGGNVENLVRLADPLGQVHAIELLERLVGAARERGYPLQRFQSLLVESLLQRGQWDAAARTLTAMPPGAGRDAPLAALWREWVSKVIDAARLPTEAAQLALVDFLRQRPWPAQVFRKTVEPLVRAQRYEAARDVLSLAVRLFPANAWAHAELTKVEAAVARRTPTNETRATPGGEMPELANEAAYLKMLDELLAAKRWADVAQHVQTARTARPAPTWLEARDAALRFAQVRASQGLGDAPGMVAATRLFLNGDKARSQQIVDFGAELARAGDTASALALTREVLRRVPDFKPAQALLAKLQPQEKG